MEGVDLVESGERLEDAADFLRNLNAVNFAPQQIWIDLLTSFLREPDLTCVEPTYSAYLEA